MLINIEVFLGCTISSVMARDAEQANHSRCQAFTEHQAHAAIAPALDAAAKAAAADVRCASGLRNRGFFCPAFAADSPLPPAPGATTSRRNAPLRTTPPLVLSFDRCAASASKRCLATLLLSPCSSSLLSSSLSTTPLTMSRSLRLRCAPLAAATAAAAEVAGDTAGARFAGCAPACPVLAFVAAGAPLGGLNGAPAPRAKLLVGAERCAAVASVAMGVVAAAEPGRLGSVDAPRSALLSIAASALMGRLLDAFAALPAPAEGGVDDCALPLPCKLWERSSIAPMLSFRLAPDALSLPSCGAGCLAACLLNSLAMGEVLTLVPSLADCGFAGHADKSTTVDSWFASKCLGCFAAALGRPSRPLLPCSRFELPGAADPRSAMMVSKTWRSSAG